MSCVSAARRPLRESALEPAKTPLRRVRRFACEFGLGVPARSRGPRVGLYDRPDRSGSRAGGRSPPCVREAEAEQRASPRRKVSMAAKVAVGGGAVDCTVRDISESGVQLLAPAVLRLPDEVHLLILSEGLLIHAQRIWERSVRGLTGSRRRTKRKCLSVCAQVGGRPSCCLPTCAHSLYRWVPIATRLAGSRTGAGLLGPNRDSQRPGSVSG